MCNTVIVLITHLHHQCFVYAIFGTATIPGLRRISGQTVRRRLHAAGLRAYRLAVRLVLMDLHRLALVAWARTHARWTRNDWRRVVFSDESRFCLQRSDGRIRIWRRRNERYRRNCIVERDRNRGGSVCIWGCVGVNTKTNLVLILLMFILANLVVVYFKVCIVCAFLIFVVILFAQMYE